VVFECDDIRTAYEELHDPGVEFTEEPTLQTWGGMQAQFKEQDGNGFVLVQE
jgi:lactoylglutathione lyase